MKIAIPTHALVIVSGGKKANVEGVAATLEWPILTWNVAKPDPSVAKLHEMIAQNDRMVVALKSGHAAARRTMARIAAKRGLVPVVITVGDHEKIDKKDEKIELVYALEGPLEYHTIPLRPDRRDDAGPFDIIGDVHGCYDELMQLLANLGHARLKYRGKGFKLIRHPQGRRVILLGDLTDRGPKNRKVVALARRLEREFRAIVICGNHDDKLARALEGRKVTIRPHTGIAATLSEYEDMPQAEREELGQWLRTRPDHLILDGGRLVVAHAGIDEANQGRITNEARAFALYGPVTGGLDAEGHPEARDWAATYKGEAVVVHGHVVTLEPKITGNVVGIDTGCVFGGKLTAYRWPERDFHAVEAAKTYWEGNTFKRLKAAA